MSSSISKSRPILVPINPIILDFFPPTPLRYLTTEELIVDHSDRIVRDPLGNPIYHLGTHIHALRYELVFSIAQALRIEDSFVPYTTVEHLNVIVKGTTKTRFSISPFVQNHHCPGHSPTLRSLRAMGHLDALRIDPVSIDHYLLGIVVLRSTDIDNPENVLVTTRGERSLLQGIDYFGWLETHPSFDRGVVREFASGAYCYEDVFSLDAQFSQCCHDQIGSWSIGNIERIFEMYFLALPERPLGKDQNCKSDVIRWRTNTLKAILAVKEEARMLRKMTRREFLMHVEQRIRANIGLDNPINQTARRQSDTA